FDQFEERHNIQLESGDVKYHQGFSTDLQTPTGNVHATLVFNPSHLEIVTPVANGSTCARQQRRNDHGKEQVMCVALHGDASFSGQGVVMEAMNMSATRGYGIGGTIHVIVNNQIGFTTSNPHDARSTLYCSDIGKMMSIPVFHVNSDDPEAVCAVFHIATEFKIKFQKDVIIDLIGYRRMGHNEADEPSATQPLMYKEIRQHPTVKDIYAEKLISAGVFTTEEITRMVDTYREGLDKRDHAVAKRMASKDWKNAYASDWTPYASRDWRIPTSTKVPLDTIKTLATARDTAPEGFAFDSRVQKIVEARRAMTAGTMLADWGYAETLAYATLLNEGYGVRLAGQDSQRGTFFHRHAVWHDQNTGDTYTSLCHVNAQQGKFWVIDSLLSEAAALGFEYGYSTSEPRTLTLWEAQFGDFANGAQVVIDQFISSGEQKWGRLSGLVLLLPHGYEGQGPEHSSARIERYMQLCAQHNIQVCVPSTPAQIYHLLRRQILRPMRKPLIVITPKSLLRHKEAVSTLDEIANGSFQVIIPDNLDNYDQIKRVILCAGKIYYELSAARGDNQKIAIVRLEQLYPFPQEELRAELQKYKTAKDVIWCQEEPLNQGAWYSSQHHLRNALLPHQELQYAGRSDSAAPAVGYFYLHEQQQHDLVKQAIGEG
ncbi:MAG TPA: 2-oxoglutarate dehydrogenase E1 component, partial [Gammaproteobacteria bacterium]|nr:2-oxoglutarate dehydrogenase E1 component [Gammaproteobacteria bacterium]